MFCSVCKCSSHRNKAIIVQCRFKLTEGMTKPHCGTFYAHSSSDFWNSCKSKPQVWQGAPDRTIQREQGSLFLYFPPEVKKLNVPVVADGGLGGGFCSSGPWRLPVCRRFIGECFHRGCCLHAPRHGHRNGTYASICCVSMSGHI